MNDTVSEISRNSNINYNESNYPQLYPELGSPSVGPYISPSFNQNFPFNEKIYGTMVCYNCLSVLLIRKDWNYARCGECQKINKIPNKNYIPLQQTNDNVYNNSNNFYDNSMDKTELIGDLPYVYGVVNCPYCTTENKITRDAKRITCYKCANSFNVNSNSNPKYVRENLTKVIHTGEYIPVYQNNNNQCNCSNSIQFFMLNRILEEIKEKKKPLIAYPTIFADPYGFNYRDLIGDNYYNYNNRYGDLDNNRKIRVPLSYSQPKRKKENEPNGFRITIKKRNKDEKGDKLSRSASSVFEKVFFTNKLKDDFGKKKEIEY